MSNFLPQTIPLGDQTILLFLFSAYKERIQSQIEVVQEEKSKDQPVSPKDRFSPPKLNSSNALFETQINKGEHIEQNKESHFEKFNGPLEKPKTANKAFGSVSDFLLFFESRNSEIKNLGNKFREMEKEGSVLSTKILNEEIAPALCKSFTKMQVEFKNHESSSNKAFKNEDDESTQNLKKAFSKFLQKKKVQKEPKNEYVQLFEKEFKTLEEFYKQILRAYTIPGFLYLRMNEYLRTENWVKLDDLLIYTYCIFKAYLWGPNGLTDATNFEDLKLKSENDKLTLYRRADFDQESLDFYQPDKIKVFSWTGVTSTSLIESVTRKFSGKKPDKKPVLIVIEVDFKNLQPENFNALYLAKLSKCPEEEEVALAPGSIFELLGIYQDQQEVVMRLKLITNAKTLAQQGKFLHGMLQAVMGKGDELKIVCLKEKELSRAIKHCQGNQLVKKFEFHLCKFNKLSVQVLLEVLPTMRNLISFTFSSVEVEDSSWPQIIKCLGKKIKNLQIENSVSWFGFKSFFSRFGSLILLENLKISVGENSRMQPDDIRILFNLVNNFASKCVFEFHFINKYEIIVKDLKRSSFKEDLANFLCETQEDSPSTAGKYFVNFPFEETLEEILTQQQEIQLPGFDIERNSENSLSKVEEEGRTEPPDLRKEVSMQAKETVVLSFTAVKELFGYGFERDSRSLKRSLLEVLEERFTLSPNEVQKNDFDEERRDSLLLNESSIIARDKEFKGAISTEKHLLKELNLGFERLSISDGELKILGQDIQYLEPLMTLKLNFNKCNKKKMRYSGQQGGITDKSLEILGKDVILQLKGLDRLNLSFHMCFSITDEGLRNLACYGLQHLQSLTALNLCFSHCWGITDEGLMRLSFEVAKIKSLVALDLNFNDCGITDEGFKSLFKDERGIQNLEFLSSLSLSFKKCRGISDEGLDFLSLRDLRNLKTSLDTLSLNFDECDRITDEGLKILCCEVVSQIESLTNFHFSFSDWQESLKISNLGIKAIAQNLSLLTNLHLNFDACKKITDEGLNNLDFCNCNKLITLNLSFNSCHQITDLGLKNLYFSKKLITLHLSFNSCHQITDFGLKFLSQNIQHLKSLENLHLNFGCCEKITDKGLDFLSSQGIAYLHKLKTLNLIFELERQSESGITDKGLRSLGYGIRNLLELKMLHLNFDDSNITDEGVRYLCRNGVQYLKKLTDLHLSFWRCQALTDEGLEILTLQGILRLKESLNTLHLNFSHCGKLSNVGLKTLWSEGIRSLSQLKKLNLKLESCQKMTNEGLEDLILGGIRNLPYLAIFNLSFFKCPMIKPKQLLSMKYQINLLNLPHLQVSFGLNMEQDLWEDYFLQGPSTASILCQGRLEFFSPFRTDLLEEMESQVTQDPKNPVEALILIFSQDLDATTPQDFLWRPGPSDVCPNDLDLFRSVFHQEKMKPFKNLKALCLVLDDAAITDFTLHNLSFDGLKHFESLDVLHMSFKRCVEITDKGLQILACQGLKHLKKLIDLSLNFDSCYKISDEGLQDLGCQGLKNLKNLVRISMNFDKCDAIKDKGLEILKEIQYPELLDKLKLSFRRCMALSDKGLINLSRLGMRRMKSLTSLSLNFDMCQNITNKGVNKLSDDGLKHLYSLELMHLSFRHCQQITKKGLKSLCRIYTKTLTSFYIDLGGVQISERLKRQLSQSSSDSFVLIRKNESSCRNETTRFRRQIVGIQKDIDEIKPDHKSAGKIVANRMFIQYLGRSHYMLNIYAFPKFERFSEEHHRTEEDLDMMLHNARKDIIAFLLLSNYKEFQEHVKEFINKMYTQELRYFQSLTSFHLILEGWKTFITDSSLNILCLNILQQLTSVTTLHLGLDGCSRISDEGLKILGSDGITHLKSLITLHISFENQISVTDVGLKILCLEGIQCLKSLERLDLNFNGCDGITDIGFESLWKDGILHLNSLAALELSFEKCRNITGICSKNLEEAEYPMPLTLLHLNFAGCVSLKKEGFESLCRWVIQSFAKLTTLNLSFDGCEGITDFGLQHLKLCHLRFLTDLYLSFDRCQGITDQGIQSLGLNHFKLLTTLHLHFDQCQNLTDQVLNNQISQLTSLQVLHMSFRGCIGAVTDQTLKNLNIAHLTSLNTLYLCFDGCNQITDQGIHALCWNGIQSLKQLKTLYLSFGLCENITKNSLESLCTDGIKDLDLLSNVYLCFLACPKISKTQFSVLRSQISSLDLPYLQRPLKLNNNTIFSESDFHQKGFFDFILSQNSSSQLKVLNANGALNEAETGDISDLLGSFISPEESKVDLNLEEVTLHKLQQSKILDGMSFEFEDRFHLAHLGFIKSSFSCQDVINDLEEIENLDLTFSTFDSKENLKLQNIYCDIHHHFRLVKNFHILFEGCVDLADKEIQIISDKIQRLQKLNKLQLSFHVCREIGDRELESLWNRIRHLRELKTLNLSFNWCSDITDDGLENITLKGILSLPSLENLELSFLNCVNLTNSSYQAFRKILAYFGFAEISKSSPKKTDTRHINFSYRPRYLDVLYPERKRK